MKYNVEQPSYHMLICLIEVWNPVDKKTGNPLSPQELMIPSGEPDFMIAEVESLEIRESYQCNQQCECQISPWYSYQENHRGH